MGAPDRPSYRRRAPLARIVNLIFTQSSPIGPFIHA
jgi:hypothetical protein